MEDRLIAGEPLELAHHAVDRRQFVAAAGALVALSALPLEHASAAESVRGKIEDMSTIKTSDGTEIFYKDLGSGPPIVFHHGWPLSSDDWDTAMLFFVEKGYRVASAMSPTSRPSSVKRRFVAS